MKFGTVINCIDGRVQLPVMEYLKNNFEPEYFDTANEAGPLKILTERTDKCRLFSLKEQITTSVEVRKGEILALVGHHDCIGNPVDRKRQEEQMHEALDYLKNAYGDEILYVGLYVNEKWEVEEIARLGS
jgi:hypothetical protein